MGMNDAMMGYWKKKADITDLEMSVHDVVSNAHYLTEKYGMSVEEVNELIANAYGIACTLVGVPNGEVKVIKFKGLPRKESE